MSFWPRRKVPGRSLKSFGLEYLPQSYVVKAPGTNPGIQYCTWGTPQRAEGNNTAEADTVK
jgi:hypothetical protein